MSLTPNAVSRIYRGETVPTPVVQVLEVKLLQAAKAAPTAAGAPPERYRMFISDGQHTLQSMLGTQLNSLVKDNTIQSNCIVKLKEYICNTVHNRKIVIVLGIELVSPPVAPIGSPQNIDTAATGGTSAQGGLSSSPTNVVAESSGPMMFRTAGGMGGSGAPPTGPRGFGGAMPAYSGARDTDLPSSIYPIASLNPYQNRWTIKARVTHKSDLREWNNMRGSGKLFSIDLLDANGGEIKATFFNEAAEKWFPLIELNRVYYISKGQIKFARKRFTSIKNEYELSLDANSVIKPAFDESDIPKMHFSFIPIANLADVQRDELVDVLGVVTEVQDARTIVPKNSAEKELIKRTLYLADRTMKSIELTVWGETAQKWDVPVGGVVAVKGARVSDFNRKSLSAVNSTHIEKDPDIAESHQLAHWFATLDPAARKEIISLTQTRDAAGGFGGGMGFGESGGEGRPRREEPYKPLAAIRSERLGTGPEPDYVSTRATVTMILHSEKQPLYYNACPNTEKKCGKRVTKLNNLWFCEKCNMQWDHCDPRYILTIMANDHTGSAWLSCFNEVGEKLLGKSAREVAQMKESGAQDAAIEAVIQDALFKTYNFSIRAKTETFNNEPRVKYQILSATTLNFVQESKKMLDKIRELQAA